jgi:hypothetical protein
VQNYRNRLSASYEAGEQKPRFCIDERGFVYIKSKTSRGEIILCYGRHQNKLLIGVGTDARSSRDDLYTMAQNGSGTECVQNLYQILHTGSYEKPNELQKISIEILKSSKFGFNPTPYALVRSLYMFSLDSKTESIGTVLHQEAECFLISSGGGISIYKEMGAQGYVSNILCSEILKGDQKVNFTYDHKSKNWVLFITSPGSNGDVITGVSQNENPFFDDFSIVRDIKEEIRPQSL